MEISSRQSLIFPFESDCLRRGEHFAPGNLKIGPEEVVQIKKFLNSHKTQMPLHYSACACCEDSNGTRIAEIGAWEVEKS